MEELKENEKWCCAKGRCCGGKALGVLALLAVGALGGYLGGRHCAAKQAPAGVAAPASPTK